MINILAADKLMQSPKMYATLLLWLLSELFENLPEAGDLDKPKLVFFFDEAHLLFNDAPAALVDKIEQVVRLIRSKGVGVYFVTQNPADVPDKVLGQLGNRVQHALRAFSARDQKAVQGRRRNHARQPRAGRGRRHHRTRRGRGAGLLPGREGPPEHRANAPSSCRRRARSARSPRPQRRHLSSLRWSPASTRKPSTANRPTRSSRRARRRRRRPRPRPPPPPGAAADSRRPGRHLGGLGDLLGGGARRSRQSVAEAAVTSAARAIGSQPGPADRARRARLAPRRQALIRPPSCGG